MSIYRDYQCPTCGGAIVSTARMSDSTKAPTNCENNHRFMRSEAAPKVKAFKLEASARLLENAHMELARSTPASKAAQMGIRDIRSLMLRLGYQCKKDVRRALYTLHFYKERGENDYHSYEVIGWHGEGIYGGEKTILEFYDSDAGSKPVFNVGIVGDSVTEARQRMIAEDIITYIKERN